MTTIQRHVIDSVCPECRGAGICKTCNGARTGYDPGDPAHGIPGASYQDCPYCSGEGICPRCLVVCDCGYCGPAAEYSMTYDDAGYDRTETVQTVCPECRKARTEITQYSTWEDPT